MDLARTDEIRSFLQLCGNLCLNFFNHSCYILTHLIYCTDDCKLLTNRCERVILLQDLAKVRKIFDSLSFEDPDWSDIATKGYNLQTLKEKCVMLSVSDSDYGEKLDSLRSDVAGFCNKCRIENLLSVFPQVGKYHNQLRAIKVLEWSPNDRKFNFVIFIFHC